MAHPSDDDESSLSEVSLTEVPNDNESHQTQTTFAGSSAASTLHNGKSTLSTDSAFENPQGRSSAATSGPVSDLDTSDYEEGTEAMPMMSLARTYVKSDMILGKGGSATVWAGYCVETKERVAIKELKDVGSDAARAIEREVGLLKSKVPKSPYLIELFDYSHDPRNRVCCLYMEMTTNGSARKYATAKKGACWYGRYHEAQLWLVIRDVLRGLNTLHLSGVIHRDLKGDNILIGKKLPNAQEAYNVMKACSEGHVPVRTTHAKLTDFGTCKETIQGTMCQTTGTVVGTVPFLSPEAVVRGKFGSRSDIWALGMTMLELSLQNQNPWGHLDCKDAFQLLLRIGQLGPPNHRPPMPLHLSPMCKRVIQRCLEFDPQSRPSASDLLADPYFMRPSMNGVEQIAPL